ncbi:WXG100 family type VII secretion target [Nocardioides marmoraquaticus]
MSHTLSSVRRWRPSGLRTAAQAVGRRAENLDEQLRRNERSLEDLVCEWTGPAARAAEDRVRTEIQFGRRLRNRVEDVETAMKDGVPRLQSARDTLLQKVDAAEADGFDVSDDWMVTDPTTVPEDEVDDRQSELDGHVEAISGALSTLSTEDAQVAHEIDSALDELRATTADVEAGSEFVPPRTTAGMSNQEVQDLLSSRRFQEWMENHPDAAKDLLDGAVDRGQVAATDPRYRDFLEQYWRDEALEAAGIDGDAWDPSRGAEANRDTITAVYDYYGQLFLDHPELQWAGMANLIGPSFAAGFYDLDMFRDIAQGVDGALPDIPNAPGSWDDDAREMLEQLRDLPDSELAYYEEKLLSMQQEIFFDQASMHEAYLLGGTEETDRMAAAGLMDGDTRSAWHDIASGDPDRVTAGNVALLEREQFDIIADDYDEMRSRPGTGEAMTWMTTVVGAPSIPGAQGYADVFPEVIDLKTPGQVGPFPVPQADLGDVVTPLPDGNIADRYDRWALIEEDTLPAYQDLLRDDPDRLRDLVGSDFDGRVDDFRLTERAPGLIHDLATDWQYRR